MEDLQARGGKRQKIQREWKGEYERGKKLPKKNQVERLNCGERNGMESKAKGERRMKENRLPNFIYIIYYKLLSFLCKYSMKFDIVGFKLLSSWSILWILYLT